MDNVQENSSLAILHFAYLASCADGTFSIEELHQVFAESQLVQKVTDSLLSLEGGSKKFLEEQRLEIEKYLGSLSASQDISNIDKEFEEAANKITAFSIQPFAIAIAITVASADGLHITEKEAIYKQAETWGCAEEDIEIFLKQINNI